MQRGEHALDAARVLLFPVAQHVADLLALQVLLAAAQGAGDDGKLAVRGPARQVFLGHIGQRPDHDVAAVVAHQLGRHALELAAKKHVQEEGLQHVVTVVAKGNLGHFELVRHPVQNAAAQPAAQAAHGLALGDHLLDNAVGVLRLDVKRHTQLLQISRQNVIRKAGLLLVQVDGNQLKVDWRAGLELEQNVQHAVAVLAARDADHHAVAGLDHVEVHNRLPHLAAQAFFQLVGFAFNFEGPARLRRQGRGFVVYPNGIHGGLSWVTTGRFRPGWQLRNRQKSQAWQFSRARPVRQATASAGWPACRSGFRAGSHARPCIRQ